MSGAMSVSSYRYRPAAFGVELYTLIHSRLTPLAALVSRRAVWVGPSVTGLGRLLTE
jgi:hypothetical protein